MERMMGDRVLCEIVNGCNNCEYCHDSKCVETALAFIRWIDQDWRFSDDR